MPIYEYRCEKGHTFEVMQRMSDDPVVTCETCAAPVERVFHPVAVHFKGKGFYNTDYGTRQALARAQGGRRALEGGRGLEQEGRLVLVRLGLEVVLVGLESSSSKSSKSESSSAAKSSSS